jgi:uncharacterized protein (TIGR02452 family)
MALIPRDEAAALGLETVRYIQAGRYQAPSGRQVDLAAALKAARVGTVEYPPDREPAALWVADRKTQISVENDTVLSVGRRMTSGGAGCALNFASATLPGGGFLFGAQAQEESIARSSGLSCCLQGSPMYHLHRSTSDSMYSDYVLYSPKIPVFRSEAGDLLEEPWYLNVVTCPAVNAATLRSEAPHRMSQVLGVMTNRAVKVLRVMAENGQRRIILGAWGCGAFGLDPEMMAGIFHELLVGRFNGVFGEVVFAVMDSSRDQRVIGPFLSRFAQG